jgi:hypothetical protein
MPAKPFLTVSVTVARQRATLADQLVVGVVTGGLLGPGLVIEGRESNRIHFAKVDGLFSLVPDRGELRLTENERGETEVRCEIWCRGMGIRRAALGVAAGATLATLAALGFDWLMVVSLPVGAALALAVDGLLWVRDRRRLRRQITAFIKNTTYLKPL